MGSKKTQYRVFSKLRHFLNRIKNYEKQILQKIGYMKAAKFTDIIVSITVPAWAILMGRGR